MGELSIFIDESGDFGETRDVRDYYLVTTLHYAMVKQSNVKSAHRKYIG